jgi:uncharacterized protein YegP (UPF0339 family)
VTKKSTWTRRPRGRHTEVFVRAGARGGWSWRLRAANGQVQSTAGEKFASKSNATRAAHKAHPGTPCFEVARGTSFNRGRLYWPASSAPGREARSR